MIFKKYRCVSADCGSPLPMDEDYYELYGNFCKDCSAKANTNVVRKARENALFHSYLNPDPSAEDLLLYSE